MSVVRSFDKIINTTSMAYRRLRRSTTSRTRGRRSRISKSWRSVKREYGVSRSIYKSYYLQPCEVAPVFPPQWVTNIGEGSTYMLQGYGVICGCLGILK
ncbi:MAG: hypothetical protein LC109_01200 [Bacteroidia bacterium]|nr:hypothetical protein [Bacteroidia bacterium]